jgi:hypothetical protein
MPNARFPPIHRIGIEHSLPTVEVRYFMLDTDNGHTTSLLRRSPSFTLSRNRTAPLAF